MVDPPMDSCPACEKHDQGTHAREKPEKEVEKDGRPQPTCEPSCLMIEDPKKYPDRKQLWNAQNWNQVVNLRESRHNSVPYHGGCASVAAMDLKRAGPSQHPRHSSSLLDELVFHWKSCTDKALVTKAHDLPVNSSYHLLKFIAQHWNHQLELITYGVSISEWFADDHDATMDPSASLQDWREELRNISQVTKGEPHSQL